MLTAKAEITVDDEITLQRFSHDLDKTRYEMIIENRDHLMPWMPWADTYHKPEDMLNFVDGQIKEFDAGRQFGYDILYRGEQRLPDRFHDTIIYTRLGKIRED